MPDQMVSVIVPAYNAARFIANAIESVLGQGIAQARLEIIIVDDGSADATRQSVAPYAEAGKVHYIYQRNQGPGAARNTGIEAAKGGLICFLDADDKLMPGSLERRAEVFRRFPDVGLVFSDIIRKTSDADAGVSFLRQQDFLGHFQAAITGADPPVYLLGDQYIACAIRFFPLIWTSTVMVRHEVLKSAGPFDTSLRASEDIDMWFRIAALTKLAYVDESLTTWNHFLSGLTSDNVGFYGDTIRFYTRLLDSRRFDASLSQALKRRIAEYHQSYGYVLFNKGQHAKARQQYQASEALIGASANTRKYILLSMLPVFLVRLLKHIKGGSSA